MKDCSKLERQRERQKYITPAAETKAERPPRVRLDKRTADWDEADPAAPDRKRVVPARRDTALTPELAREGIVTAIRPRVCRIYADEATLSCRPIAGLAVGDRVTFAVGSVREILP